MPGNKNELKTSGGISTSGYFFEGSYAVDSQIVVLCDYHTYKTQDAGTFSVYRYGETGAGYYGYLDENTKFDVLGGFGLGNVSENDNVDQGFLSGSKINHYNVNNNYSQFFLQSDVGLSENWSDAGVSAKICYLAMDHPHFQIQKSDDRGQSFYQDSTYTISPHVFIFQPAVIWNLGFKNVKFHCTVGFSIPLGPERDYWSNSSQKYLFFFSEGIALDLFRSN